MPATNQNSLLAITPQTTAQLVGGYMRNYCQDQVALSAGNPSARQLWETLQTTILGGGKRLRPYLVLLAYQACGGDDINAILPIAVAWEFLHQSLLIHDDIIDRDYTRHGQPNAAGIYRALYQKLHIAEPDLSHYADSAALLTGDLALSAAYQLIHIADLPTAQVNLAAQYLATAMATVAGGELADTESVMLPVDVVDALGIAKHKTASYSFVGPLQTGAMLADAPAETIASFGELGQAIGIAFQLQDDLLGLFGNPAKTGKPNDSDIREGKRTLLLQYTYQAADHQQRATIDSLIGNPSLTTSQAEQFRTLVTDLGARAKVEKAIVSYIQQAQQHLQALDIKPEAKARFGELIDYLLQREH